MGTLGMCYVNYKTGEEARDPAIQRHIELLQRLAKERILTIHKNHGRFEMREACDDYFEIDLTTRDDLELSELFREIAEELESERDGGVENEEGAGSGAGNRSI